MVGRCSVRWSAMKLKYRQVVIADRCKECGFCIEFCPRQVLHESTEFNSKGYHPVYADSDNDCLHCGLCELICPEFALCVEPVNEEVTRA